jgi:bifunctional non-homologous end joining protein LigD
VIVDGELIAYGADGRPDFPRLSERMLHGGDGIPVRLVVFDVLAVAGVSTLAQPYSERRAILEELELGPHAEAVATFDDGQALFAAVQAMDLEGIVAKRLSGTYRPGERVWVKTKNRGYWRYPLEVEAVRRSRELASDLLPHATTSRSPFASASMSSSTKRQRPPG